MMETFYYTHKKYYQWVVCIAIAVPVNTASNCIHRLIHTHRQPECCTVALLSLPSSTSANKPATQRARQWVKKHHTERACYLWGNPPVWVDPIWTGSCQHTNQQLCFSSVSLLQKKPVRGWAVFRHCWASRYPRWHPINAPQHCNGEAWPRHLEKGKTK